MLYKVEDRKDLMVVEDDIISEFGELVEDTIGGYKPTAEGYVVEGMCGTTGLKGGDSGHGGRTVISFKFNDSCDAAVYLSEKNFEYNLADFKADDCAGGLVSIVVGGDCEALELLDTLKHMVAELEKKLEKTT